MTGAREAIIKFILLHQIPSLVENPLKWLGPIGCNEMKTKNLAQNDSRKWTQFLLPLGLLICSFVSVPSLNDPATLPRTLIWSICAILFIAIGISKGKLAQIQLYRFPKLIVGSMLGLIVAFLISIFAAFSFAEALMATLRMGMVLSGIILVAWQFQIGKADALKYWLLSLWIIGFSQSLIALIQVVSSESVLPQGTQMNSNLLGTLLAMAIPVAVYFLFYGNKQLRIPVGLSLPIMVLAIYFSASRTALIILFVFVLLGIVASIFAFRKRESWKKYKLLGLGLGLSLVLGFGFLMLKGSNRKESEINWENLWRSEMRIQPKTNSIDARLILANRSIQMFLQHPLTGVGAGNWKLEISNYGIQGFGPKDEYGQKFFVRPHNDFLWVLSETGVLGFLSYLTLIFGLVWWAFRILINTKSSQGQGLILLTIFGIVAYIIDSLFSFPLERLENTVFLSVFVGILSFMDSDESHQSPIKIPTKTIFGVLILIFGFQTVLTVYKLPKDAAVTRMRLAKSRKNWQKVEEESKKADSYWTRYEAQSTTPFAWYQTAAIVEQARTSQNGKNMNQALVKANQALEYAPSNLLCMTELASTYALMNRWSDAIEAYNNMLKIYPDNNEGWVNLGICYFNTNRFDEAKKALLHVDQAFKSSNFEALQAALAK